MTPEEKLFDDVLSNALDILRLSAAKQREILRRLADMERELIEKLSSAELSRGEEAKIRRFIENADDIIKRGYAAAQSQLELQGVARTVSNITAKSMTVALGRAGVKRPTEDYFAAIMSETIVQGVPQAEWWSRQEDHTRLAFQGAVRQGLAGSETNQQLIARIVGKPRLGEAGIMEIERRNAAALVQTSVSSVANDARRSTWASNADIIDAIKQVSTLDGHTSQVCIAYSGAMWRIEDFKPMRVNGKLSPAYNGGCPRHFNCRSLEVPILKSYRDLGIDVDEVKPSTRASDEGQIDAKTDFDAFLKRKGQVYVDDMLGVGKAELWRAGKITLRDLVNGQGRPLTLSELRLKAGVD